MDKAYPIDIIERSYDNGLVAKVKLNPYHALVDIGQSLMNRGELDKEDRLFIEKLAVISSMKNMIYAEEITQSRADRRAGVTYVMFKVMFLSDADAVKFTLMFSEDDDDEAFG
jgi:hypothetical protein